MSDAITQPPEEITQEQARVMRDFIKRLSERTCWIGVPIDTEAASYLGQTLQEIVFEAQQLSVAIRGAKS